MPRSEGVPEAGSVSANVKGKTYEGRYVVEDEMIAVYYGDHHKTTQIGGSDLIAGSLAFQMLLEILRAAGVR